MDTNVKLPRNLSPQGKKALLTAEPTDRFMATVELAPNASPETLQPDLDRIHAVCRSWSPASRVMSVEIGAREIADLAGMWDVTYVDIGSRFAP